MNDLGVLANHDVEKVPIEEIAFLVAREKHPSLDRTVYRERIDEFARRAAIRVANVQGGHQVAEALGRYLFEEEGFRGNSSDYYNPANSFLNDVMDQRRGIPITLSILYIAIGRRLGLPLSGVAFPGHFLVRFDDPFGAFFVDPFHQGKILTESDCRRRLQDLFGGEIPFHPEFVMPSRHREILVRMLTNLKVIYMTRREFAMALQILNRILLFNPLGMEEMKERGLVYYHMECFGKALQDLETYLSTAPAPQDKTLIEEYIEDLRGKVDQIQ